MSAFATLPVVTLDCVSVYLSEKDHAAVSAVSRLTQNIKKNPLQLASNDVFTQKQTLALIQQQLNTTQQKITTNEQGLAARKATCLGWFTHWIGNGRIAAIFMRIFSCIKKEAELQQKLSSDINDDRLKVSNLVSQNKEMILSLERSTDKLNCLKADYFFMSLFGGREKFLTIPKFDMNLLIEKYDLSPFTDWLGLTIKKEDMQYSIMRGEINGRVFISILTTSVHECLGRGTDTYYQCTSFFKISSKRYMNDRFLEMQDGSPTPTILTDLSPSAKEKRTKEQYEALRTLICSGTVHWGRLRGDGSVDQVTTQLGS